MEADMALNISACLTNNSSSRNDVNPFRSPKNSRVGSAIRSVSQLTNRVSLQDFSTKMKARKIQLYRNGDPFFKGVTTAITQERFRTFNSLLSEVNKSAICDPSILQKGVRHIFSLQGEPIYDLDQLKDGQSYVCSSTPVFKRLKYEGINSFNWYTSLRKVTPRSYEKLDVSERSQTPDYVPSQPKMVVVIRAGPRPRNMVRMLLNRRTTTSFDQVLTHLASALNMKTGTIRKMYMMTGPQGGYLLNAVVGQEHNEVEASVLLMQLCRALAYLHSLNIVHRNIRPDKIVVFRNLDGSRTVKLGDFGLATEVSGLLYKLCGTAAYLAPEMLARTGSRVTRLALKIIDKSQLTQQQQSAVDCEVSLIRCISHPNILQLMDELDTPSELYLIMEFIKTNGPGQKATQIALLPNSTGTEPIAALVGQEMSSVVDKVLPTNSGKSDRESIMPTYVFRHSVKYTDLNRNGNNSKDIPSSYRRGHPIQFLLSPQDQTYRAFKKVLAGHAVRNIGSIACNLTMGFTEEDFSIVKVYENRHYHHLERYLSNRDQLLFENGEDGLNEQYLLHGTSPENARTICALGFDRSKCGDRATFGVGAYFTNIVAYAASYALPNSFGFRVLLLSKVLCGHSTVGSSGLKEMPLYDYGKPFDTCVDDLDQPTVYVTMRDDLVYTTHLIYFATSRKVDSDDET